jgi:hypothetical protein
MGRGQRYKRRREGKRIEVELLPKTQERSKRKVKEASERRMSERERNDS